MAALCSSLSIGVTFIPSILGAMLGSTLIYFLIITLLSPHEERGAWRLMIWPFTASFAGIISIGRIGCWWSGCCFGEVSTGWWSTQYRAHHLVTPYHLDRYGELVNGLPFTVHPTQLYEAIALSMIVASAFQIRKKVNETSVSFIVLGSYLALRFCIDPYRAAINTLSSFSSWGPFSHFQWYCLGLAILSFGFAFKYRSIFSPSLSDHELQRSCSDDHIFRLIGGWAVIALCTLISARLGTPFTAQLSVLALCLATTPLIILIRSSYLRFPESLVKIWAVHRLPAILASSLVLLTTPFVVVAPFTSDLIAKEWEGASTSLGSERSLDGRGWVYTLDPLTKKLGRIGRVDELPALRLELEDLDLRGGGERELTPWSSNVTVIDGKVKEGELEVDDEPKVSEDVSPRLRLLLGGGGGKLKSMSAGGCGGNTYYEHKVKAAHLFASYRFGDGDWKKSVVGSIRRLHLQTVITSDQGFDREEDEQIQLVYALGLLIESSWLRLGLAPRFSTLIMGDRDKIQLNDPFGLDYRLGLGFTLESFSLFGEMGSGPSWSMMPLLDHRASMNAKIKATQDMTLSLRLSLIGISDVTKFSSPSGEIGIEMPSFELYIGAMSANDGGLTLGGQFGLKL